MKNSHSFFLRYLGIALMSFCTSGQAQQISLEAASEGLQEARELCSSIGEQEKRLAKTAGYDLDKLCGSLDLIEFSGSEQPEEPLVTPCEEKKSATTTKQTALDKKPTPVSRKSRLTAAFWCWKIYSDCDYRLSQTDPDTGVWRWQQYP